MSAPMTRAKIVAMLRVTDNGERLTEPQHAALKAAARIVERWGDARVLAQGHLDDTLRLVKYDAAARRVLEVNCAE